MGKLANRNIYFYYFFISGSQFEGYDTRAHCGLGGSTSYSPNTLCKTFLGLKPKPTMDELQQALEPLGLSVRMNLETRKNYVPRPDKGEGWLKYDPEGYEKLLEHEGQKRREYMIQVIKSRGIDYDVEAGIQKDKEIAESRAAFGKKLRTEGIGA